MPTVTKTWSFATTAESFVATTGSGSHTLSYDSGVGNPAGSLKAVVSGKNVAAATSYWEYTGTWASMGVPTGSTVTSVRLLSASNRCTNYTSGRSGSQIGPYELRDSAGTTLIGTLYPARSITGTEASWTSVGAQTAIDLSSLGHTDATQVRIRLADLLGTANTTGATVTTYDDEVSLEITYSVTNSNAPNASSSATGTNGGTGNYTINKPSGTVNGDLLICINVSDWDSLANAGLPTGFTALTTAQYDAGTNNMHIAIGYRIASSEPASYTVPGGSSSDSAGTIIRVTNASSTPTIAQVAPSALTAGTSAVTAPSITPNTANDLLICYAGINGANGSGAVSWTAPSGMSEVADVQSTTWSSLGVAVLQAPSNPSGTKTFTTSTGNHNAGAVGTISIAPPSTPASISASTINGSVSFGTPTIVPTNANVNATTIAPTKVAMDAPTVAGGGNAAITATTIAPTKVSMGAPTVIAWLAPITVSSAGSYSNLYIKSTDSNTDAIHISTTGAVTIDRCFIEHAGRGISGVTSNMNITVTNCTFTATTPTVTNDEQQALRLDGMSNITVQHNTFKYGHGIQLSTQGNIPSTALNISYNDYIDVGKLSVPSNYQGAVHCDTVTMPDGVISWNRVTNHYGSSYCEDTIAITSGGGTSGHPVLVHHNMVNGSYPASGNGASFTGGAFDMADISGGYIQVSYCYALNYTNNGFMMPTAGVGVSYSNCAAMYDGLADEGSTTVSSTFGWGITVDNLYDANGSTTTVQNCRVGHRRWSGTAWETANYQYYNSGTQDLGGNTTLTPNATNEQALIDEFEAMVTSNNITIGPLSTGAANVNAATIAPTKVSVGAPSVGYTATVSATTIAPTVVAIGAPSVGISTPISATTIAPTKVTVGPHTPAAGVGISPAVIAPTKVAVNAPTVTAGTGASINAATIAPAAVSVNAPTVNIATQVSATTIAPTKVSVNAPTVVAGTQAAVTGTTVAPVKVAVGPHTQGAGSLVLAASIAGIVALGTTTVFAGQGAAPAPTTIASVASVNTPSVSAGGSATVGATTIAPTKVALNAAVVHAGTSFAATTIAPVKVNVGAPVVRVATPIAPATVSPTKVNVGSPTVGYSAGISPVTISPVPAAVGSVLISYGASVLPATIFGTTLVTEGTSVDWAESPQADIIDPDASVATFAQADIVDKEAALDIIDDTGLAATFVSYADIINNEAEVDIIGSTVPSADIVSSNAGSADIIPVP